MAPAAESRRQPICPFFGDFLWTSKESYPAAGRNRRSQGLEIHPDSEKNAKSEGGAPTGATTEKGDSMSNRQEVIVTDIRMSFISMVVFMIKWVIAAIPALLILSLIFGLLSMIFTGFMGGMMGQHMGPYR
jgi:hypothetical protein